MSTHIYSVRIYITTAEHHGLRDMCFDIDCALGTPMLAGCKVRTPEDVSKTLKAMADDPHCEDNVVEH